MSTTDEVVRQLSPDKRGRWLVTTQGTRHIWDLDAMTYIRMPGPESVTQAMEHDQRPVHINRVQRWPAVDERFLIWFDDPDEPFRCEHWRLSSTVKSIEPLTDQPVLHIG